MQSRRLERVNLTVHEGQGTCHLVDAVHGVQPLPGIPDVIKLCVVEEESWIADTTEDV